MSIPPVVVATARMGWNWQWNQLMNGLAPADVEGNYQRPQSQHRKAKLTEICELEQRSSELLPRLLIGRSCPWAHRTWLVHQLRDLKDTLTIQLVYANHSAGRWELETPWMGCESLLDIYKRCGSPPSHRATVPALVDPGKNQEENPSLIGNESTQLIKVLNQWPTSKKSHDLAPAKLKDEINNWDRKLKHSVNDGVYRCGFARNQAAYNKASQELFSSLEMVDESLSRKGPWLCGKEITLADIRLFPTLIRWEMIYMPLFGCSQRPLWSFRNIWQWRQRFMALQSVSSTCDAQAWRNDYFGALFPLNPSNIVPAGPDLMQIINVSAPHLQ